MIKRIRIINHKWSEIIDNLNRKQSPLGYTLHFIVIFLIILITINIINLLFVDVTTVRGKSMEPTLYENNRLVIFKSERIIKNLFGQYVPDRGDIIVFEVDNAQGQKIALVKRVIGLPNETIIIKDGQLTIYNTQNPTGFTPDINLADNINLFATNDDLAITTSDKEIFVLGDNRPYSEDSRSFGNISLDAITGELIVRVWPLSQLKTF